MDLLRKLVKFKLQWAKKNEMKLYEVLDGYLSERILDGEIGRRQELVNIQNRIEECHKLLKHLKKI